MSILWFALWTMNIIESWIWYLMHLKDEEAQSFVRYTRSLYSIYAYIWTYISAHYYYYISALVRTIYTNTADRDYLSYVESHYI